MISIVLSDEQTLFRDGLRAMLTAQDDVRILAEVATADAVLPWLARATPDVVLLSIRRIGAETLKLIQTITAHRRTPRVVVLAERADRHQVAAVRQHGAAGLIVRSSSATELCQAIRAAAAGAEYFVDVACGRSQAIRVDEAYERLSPREREILQLLAEGFGNTAIAKSLLISPRTVETHRANVMRKLDLRTRSDLIRYAVRKGLLDDH